MFFTDLRLKQSKNILNVAGKDPIKFFKLQNSNNKDELIEQFYSLLLYFKINLDKDSLSEILKDDKIVVFLSKKLIIFNDLYKGLILEKDIMRKLIKNAKNFDEILCLLHYIGTDIIDFLQLIYSEYEFIKNIFCNELDKLNEENEGKDKNDKKEIKKIDIDKYIIPKRNDNINKLNEVAGLLLNNERLEGIHMIIFSKNVIEKYIEFNFGKNLDNIQLINNLIGLIKKYGFNNT